MKKTLLKSSTTTTVAGAGAAGAGVITLIQIAQTLFPHLEWLKDPNLLIASSWFINVMLVPMLSRMIARARGK